MLSGFTISQKAAMDRTCSHDSGMGERQSEELQFTLSQDLYREPRME